MSDIALVRELERVRQLVAQLIDPDVGEAQSARVTQALRVWVASLDAYEEHSRRELAAVLDEYGVAASKERARAAYCRQVAHCIDFPLCGHGSDEAPDA